MSLIDDIKAERLKRKWTQADLALWCNKAEPA